MLRAMTAEKVRQVKKISTMTNKTALKWISIPILMLFYYLFSQFEFFTTFSAASIVRLGVLMLIKLKQP